MRYFRALLLLGLVVSTARCGEVFLLKGDPIKGDIVSVSEKEVVIKVGDKQIAKSIPEVVKIDFREQPKPPRGKTYTQVELTDGTTLLASKWLIKKKVLELTLLAGTEVKVPQKAVANVLNNAQEEKNRIDWKTRTFNLRGKEAFVVFNKELKRPATVLATLGETDESGESITVAREISGKVVTGQRVLANLHGLVFKNILDRNAPRQLCQLFATGHDFVIVSGLELKTGGIRVTTQSNAKIDFTYEQIARLDYAPGKLDFLSSLKRFEIYDAIVADDPTEARKDHPIIVDRNANNRPIRFGGRLYAKGLTLFPGIELTYDLKGDYRELSMTVGIDDESRSQGDVELVIEGDNTVLKTIPITYLSKKGKGGEIRTPARPVKEVVVTIKDVQKLKLALKAKGDPLNGVSINVSLGNAKVSK